MQLRRHVVCVLGLRVDSQFSTIYQTPCMFAHTCFQGLQFGDLAVLLCCSHRQLAVQLGSFSTVMATCSCVGACAVCCMSQGWCYSAMDHCGMCSCAPGRRFCSQVVTDTSCKAWGCSLQVDITGLISPGCAVLTHKRGGDVHQQALLK